MFPLRLNFTGMDLPALTVFSTGGLSTGERKPVKLYSTVTVKVHALEVLPAPSVAVQDTLVVPTEKVDPDGGVQAAVAVQLSLAVAV